MMKISVIIPTYNRASTLKRAVDSVLTQEGDGSLFSITEIIIVDDGSTDGSEEIVTGIKDDRIRYHRFSENRGAGIARNTAVGMATEEWIAFHDSDDVWHKSKLKQQVAFLEKNPEVKLIGCGYDAFLPDGRRIRMKTEIKGDYFSMFAKQNFIGSPTIMISKSCFDSLGGFDESLKALEDWEFLLRFSDRYPIGYLQDVLLDAYVADDGMSSKAGYYYDSRARLIAKNKDALLKRGCFDSAVEEMMKFAQRSGLLNEAMRLLEIRLQQASEE